MTEIVQLSAKFLLFLVTLSMVFDNIQIIQHSVDLDRKIKCSTNVLLGLLVITFLVK